VKDGGTRTARQLAGDAGEDAALLHLQKHGLTLVERNFSCRGGELDLVMRDGATVVFVEVRRRASSAYGGAAATIGRCRQHLAAALPDAAGLPLRRHRHRRRHVELAQERHSRMSPNRIPTTYTL
jgi:putative endonuclease